MILNNLKLVNKAFDLLKEKEAKINYYYEPIFSQKNKKWKRHLNFSELRQDFIKDIIDYGFCPYIERTCEEQMKSKDIMKFYKEKNHDFTRHIKKINFNLKNKISNDKKLNNKILSCENNKKADIKYKKIPKIITNKNNSFLSNLYNVIYETNINKNRKRNKSTNNSINKIKAKIVKFSRDDIIDYKKIKKQKLKEDELNKSFSYESNEDGNVYKDIKTLEKYSYKNYNKNNINNRQKNRMSSCCNSQIIKNPFINIVKPKKPNRKILKLKSYNNNSLIKNITNTTIFRINKNFFQNKHNKRYNHKNKSIEDLENISGGIFKIAVKYDYLSKKYKDIK